MHSAPRTSKVNGIEVVYLRDAHHTLVMHWAEKYKARLMEERVPRFGIDSDLVEIGWGIGLSIDGSRPEYQETHIVQVATAWLGAGHEAALIEHLLSTDNAQDHRETRLTLSNAGYPDSVLDTVPEPK